MAFETNEHYTRVLTMINANKDSIFEPCKILEFDTTRMVANVQFLNSKQRREDVLVLFPSLFFNSGIIAPPANNTTALAFWGADRTPYVLPAQYVLPDVSVENGVVKQNASPAKFDDMFDLSNVQQGELLLRSLGGSYVFLKNKGEIEIATQQLHRLTLDESDGSFNVQVDKTTSKVGNVFSSLGEYVKKDGSKTTDQQYRLEAKSKTAKVVTELSDKDFVQSVLTRNYTGIDIDEGEDTFKVQALNVFNGNDEKEVSPIDQSELFLKTEFSHENQNTSLTVSKKGTLKYSIEEAEKETSFTIKKGDVLVKIEDKEISFMDLLKRVNELSTKNGLEEL